MSIDLMFKFRTNMSHDDDFLDEVNLRAYNAIIKFWFQDHTN